jgi:hypothetical protein
MEQTLEIYRELSFRGVFATMVHARTQEDKVTVIRKGEQDLPENINRSIPKLWGNVRILNKTFFTLHWVEMDLNTYQIIAKEAIIPNEDYSVSSSMLQSLFRRKERAFRLQVFDSERFYLWLPESVVSLPPWTDLVITYKMVEDALALMMNVSPFYFNTEERRNTFIDSFKTKFPHPAQQHVLHYDNDLQRQRLTISTKEEVLGEEKPIEDSTN